MNKKMIIKNPTTNQYYSLAEKTLIQLSLLSNENIILHGIKAGNEIKLDEEFNKIKYIQNTSELLGNGKIFTHNVDITNLKCNKIIL